jgi:ribosomal protein S18 acetylase RimI-like enzyme
MQIEWLSVDEPYRRQGLARRLMIEQFRYHAAHDKRYCFVYTNTDNTATINLNASLGFTTQAEVWGWTWPHKI